MKQWLDVIEACPIFHNIVQEPAGWTFMDWRGLGDKLAPLGERRFRKRHICDINFFWCDMLYTPAVGVPIREHAVSYLMDHYFRTPTEMPYHPEHRPAGRRGA